MKKIIINATGLILITIFIQGCTSARPYSYNGKYYMVGDSNCSRFNQRAYNTINCFNSDGEPMGYRNAMTDQDMQMYNSQQAQNHRNQIEQQRQNDRQADKNHDSYCSMMPAGTYGCN
jgi:hypothetical protein